jgi:hypothetical protein
LKQNISMRLFRGGKIVFGIWLTVVSLTALPVTCADGFVLTNGSVQLKAGGDSGPVWVLPMSGNLAQIQFTNYHGWTHSIVMRNRLAEVVIVPAIGRIMQFRFIDQPDGPFWENAAMYGVQPSSTSWDTPGSFGGDKVWPSPQTWPWPPPRAFDSMNFTAGITNGVVTLTGPVDATFGTRVVRCITLHPTEPILRISNTFEKVSGDAIQIGVWIITQLKEGQRVFMPVPKNSVFLAGYTPIGDVPSGLVVTNGLVSLFRDPNAFSKIGNDADALLWVGTNNMLLIKFPHKSGVANTEYPDGGCSAEIYTNPDPTPYIEMELLAPLATLGAGNTSEATVVYSLFRRTQPTALQEAKKVFAP